MVRDYGHLLLFGAFLTPSAAAGDRIVELVAWCESIGLDLVTFQDHPYQPRFLETWTLLSFVAARTTRIRLAPNVANLPLRHPALLARAVASLDRLTHGRVELGIGAGFFWDAIEGMGGRRLAPQEAVAALSEALDILRSLWDTSRFQFVTYEGAYYWLPGTQPGPSPAHPVSIWIGGYRRRMLQLIGEKGDGWLPSLAYLESLDDLAKGNRIIDESAGRAGRDPSEIRRLLNISGRFTSRSRGLLDGPPLDWVEQLTELALRDGVSAFILASDDRTTLECFAKDVAPAVRERVAAERARASPPVASREPVPLLTTGQWVMQRTVPLSPLIDYAAIPAELADKVITPRDPRYEELRSVYMARGKPGLIIRCTSPQEVALALAFARTQAEAPLSIRSGGHGIAGLSTLTTFLWLVPASRTQPPIGQLYAVFASDDVDRAGTALAPFLRLGPVLDQRAVLIPYASLVPPTQELHVGQQTVKIRNGFLDRLSGDDARAVAELLGQRPTVLVELRSMGGAAAGVDPLATAFAHRTQEVWVAAWFQPVPGEEQDRAWHIIAPRLRGLYAAYTSDTRPERVREAFPSPTFERLVMVKRQYDPDNVFRRGLVVPVEAASDASPALLLASDAERLP